MQPKSNKLFKGLNVSVCRAFINDVQILGNSDRLVSVTNEPLPDGITLNESKFDATFGVSIDTNAKFVSDIRYFSDANGNNSEDESLVSPMLLNMTSYDKDFDDVFDEDGEKMSFDDLGQMYTNISRKRILSKVIMVKVNKVRRLEQKSTEFSGAVSQHSLSRSLGWHDDNSQTQDMPNSRLFQYGSAAQRVPQYGQRAEQGGRFDFFGLFFLDEASWLRRLFHEG